MTDLHITKGSRFDSPCLRFADDVKIRLLKQYAVRTSNVQRSSRMTIGRPQRKFELTKQQ